MSDRILFPCPACQKRIRSRANKAGQTVQCPQCNAAVVVPGAVEKPPAATATAQKRATPPGESVSLSKSPSGAAPAQPQVPAQLSAPPVAKPKPKSKPEVKSISVRCGSCSTAVDAPVSLIGKSVRCPDCHASIPVRAKKAESQSSTGRDVEATQRAHRGLGNSTQSFGFSCTLCGTRLYAEQSQIGKELTCPDCHSDVRVPTPTRSAPKVDVVPPPENSNEADFNLEDVSERPKYQPTNRGKVSRSDMEMLERTSALAPTSPTSPTNPPDASPAFPPDPEESRLTSSATPAARQGPPTQSPPTQRPPAQRPPAQGPPAQDSTQGRPTTRKPKSGVTLAAVCPHCHTRLGFREVQIGKRVRCGDCHGEFVVKPAEKKAALSEPPEATDDDVFALSEAVERPVIDPMAHQSLAKVERAGQQAAAGATETINPLATAEQEAVEEEEDRSDISDVGYFRRTLGLFVQGEAIARCCLLVIMDACMWWLVNGGAGAAQSDGLAQIYTLVYILLGVAVFIPVTLGTLANVFAITADTATGAQIVETWPEDIFADWIGNAVTMFFICIVSGLPGSLLAIASRELVPDPALSFFLMELTLGCGFAIVFPIVLLSVLEGDGLGSMVSPPVITSLAIAKKSWGLFYLETMALAILMVPVFAVINRPIFALLLVASAWKFVLVFVYFRLLGVLGFRVAKALNEHHNNQLDDDSED